MASTFLTVGRAFMSENFYVSAMPPADRLSVGKAYARYPDGSGVNTAAALARFGVRSCVMAKIGDDVFGDIIEEYLSDFGVTATHLIRAAKNQTGACAIITENLGVRRKILMEGANRTLNNNDIDFAYSESRPNYVIINGDIPSESVRYAVDLADDISAKVLLSVCTEFAVDIDLESLCSVEILVIDALNAKRRTNMLPGDVPTNLKICSLLSEQIGAKYYILRCPDGSCFAYNGKYYYVIPAYEFDPLDTSASLECFNAALLLKYLLKGDIKVACEFAALCEIITTQKLGAPGSLPSLSDVRKFVKENQLDERLVK